MNKITSLFQIFKTSPWDNDNEDDNIFTKKRKEKLDFKFNDFNFNFNGKIFLLVLAGFLALWISDGFYTVQEGEQAAIYRFGKFNRIAYPGINFCFPNPIETKDIEKVDQSRRIEIGYRSSGSSGVGRSNIHEVRGESMMLTSDENILNLHVDIAWHINDLKQYLFNVKDPQHTIKDAAESAIRDVIGNTPISSALSNQKEKIARNVESNLQGILDHYNSGVTIEHAKLLIAEPPQEAIDAYRDVQTAKADKEKVINQAYAYRNDILPRARGEAERLKQHATGYASEAISKSKGDTEHFSFILKQYTNNKNIMLSRMQIDAMEHILKGSKKYIIGAEGMLPHMAINKEK